MIFCVTVMIIAFYWLMDETKWLTVRLPYGRRPTIISINELLQIAICIVIVIYAFKRICSLTQKPKLREKTNANTS